MVDKKSIAAHALIMRMISLSVNEILLTRYRNWFTNLRISQFNEELTPSLLKHIQSFLFSLSSPQGYVPVTQLELISLPETLNHFCCQRH